MINFRFTFNEKKFAFILMALRVMALSLLLICSVRCSNSTGGDGDGEGDGGSEGDGEGKELVLRRHLRWACYKRVMQEEGALPNEVLEQQRDIELFGLEIDRRALDLKDPLDRGFKSCRQQFSGD